MNIFLVPCLRPLLRARWLPMMRRRLLFDVWKERGRRKEEEAQVFSFFFKDEVVCCRSVLCVKNVIKMKLKTNTSLLCVFLA